MGVRPVFRLCTFNYLRYFTTSHENVVANSLGKLIKPPIALAFSPVSCVVITVVR
jgi:hypothetical protein